MNVSYAAVPAFVLAQSEIGVGGWYGALVNYGALGIWVAFMVYRDYRESQKQDKRHEENLSAFKKIEDAYRTNTDLLIVGLGAMKTIDAQYLSLLDKIRAANAPKP